MTDSMIPIGIDVKRNRFVGPVRVGIGHPTCERQVVSPRGAPELPPLEFAKNEFGRRLLEAMRNAEPPLGFNQLDRAAGRGPGYVSKVISSPKEKKPRPETIEQLAAALKINYGWLAIGEGPMAKGLRYRDLKGWPEAEEAARITRPKLGTPIRAAGDTQVFLQPREGRLTDAFVLRLALLVRDCWTKEQRESAEAQELEEKRLEARRIPDLGYPNRESGSHIRVPEKPAKT